MVRQKTATISPLRNNREPRLSEFAQRGTSTVSDALDRLGLSGVVPGLRPLTVIGPIVGRVVTLKLDVDDGQRAARHLGALAIAALSQGDIIVVDNGGREASGCWGSLLSTAALAAGCAGVILDGASRDVANIRARGLPVFGRGATPVSARGRVREIGTQVAISVGKVRVEPGDVCVADEDGVVFIPAAAVEETLMTVHEIAAAEDGFERDLLAGRPAADVLGHRYETLTGGSAR